MRREVLWQRLRRVFDVGGQLALCALVAACIFLCAIGFTLGQFCSGKLTGLGELIAVALASAVAVGDLARTLWVVGKRCIDVQDDGSAKNQSKYFHVTIPPGLQD
jgi:hypothetical protein